MPPSRDVTSARKPPQPVLILCADEGLAGEIVRELAARRYQPLIGRPGLSWSAALDWARPAAAVVDTRHPAVSDELRARVDGREIRIIVFGDATPVTPHPSRGPWTTSSASVRRERAVAPARQRSCALTAPRPLYYLIASPSRARLRGPQ
jgi:hypothetical protein